MRKISPAPGNEWEFAKTMLQYPNFQKQTFMITNKHESRYEIVQYTVMLKHQTNNQSYSELLSKFGDISFNEYLSKGISNHVFYGDLVYKLRRVKNTANFISSGLKIVKRLRWRQYDPVIIERTIVLVLGPSTALYEPFLKHCTLTNKAVGTIWRALSKRPQRRQGPDLFPL